ncbi:MAG: hypothetical protein JNN11_01930 [Candidatus Doudnabacteria bacterium]|nr:hypothetical protein [Candidatus Doudnabacteria bacterium]
MTPSIYINLEDDVTKIVARIKREKSSEMVLVCPKRCFLFNDTINLRLLKKQVDLLGKKVFILTMDERGQAYAKEAGFELKYLPTAKNLGRFTDIGARPEAVRAVAVESKKTRSSEKQATKEVLLRPKKNVSVSASGEKKNHQVQKSPGTEPEILTEYKSQESLFPKELETAYKSKQAKKRFYRGVSFFALASLGLLLAVVFFVLPQAEIVVYRKQQALARNLVVSATTQKAETDVASMVVPATKVSQLVQAEIRFQSQGKKEVGNKAYGSVVIYNFTNSPINLRAKTTVFKLNNKNYILKSDILQLKPTRYKNAKTREVDESSLAAPFEIEAENGGESYNVPAGTRLEVINQVFGSSPQLLYAKASSAVTGGTSRYLSYITEEDTNNAKQELKKQVLQNLNSELAAKGLRTEQKALQFSSEQFVFDHPTGTETPNFTGKMSAQADALAYSASDLETVSLERVRQSLASQGDIEVRLNSAIQAEVKSADLNTGLMVLDAHFDGIAVAMPKTLDNLPAVLKGKKQANAAEYIKSNAQVEKVEITLVPGWQTYLPFIEKSINVTIK